MKLLNGKKYFEREDIDKCFKSALYSLVDPSLLEKHSKIKLSFDPTVLYSVHEDEMDTIKSGISKLNNTLSWELTSETAIKLEVIESCYQSLRIPASNLISYEEYQKTTLKDTTNDIMIYYENWLLSVGNDILFYFLNC